MVFAGPFRAARTRVVVRHNRRPSAAADATVAAPRAMSPRRAWLCALYDQLGDIDEATKHNLAPLAAALEAVLTGAHDDGEPRAGDTDGGDTASGDVPAPNATGSGTPAQNSAGQSSSDLRARVDTVIVDALFPVTDGNAAIRAAMLDGTAALDYMTAVEILRGHGLTVEPAENV